MLLALGLIETKGLVGAIEAADAMCKAANVKLVSKEKVTGALIVIKVVGEVAAVQSSVDAGAAAAQRVGQLISAHVIPRPDEQMESIIYENLPKESKVKKKQEPQTEKSEQPEKITEAEKVDDEVIEDEDIDQSSYADEVDEEELPEDEKYDGDLFEKDDESQEDKFNDDEQVAGDIPPKSELQKLNVHELRRLARSIDSFPIKGREISKANRQVLIDYFDSLR